MTTNQSYEYILSLQTLVKDNRHALKAHELTDAQLEGFKSCLAFLKAVQLMQKQLTDARNIAYRKDGASNQYPPAFKHAGVSAHDSEKAMKDRQPLVSAYFQRCLEVFIKKRL